MSTCRHILVPDFLEQSAARLPQKIALVHQGKRLTYAEIEDLADRLASGLRVAGVERGDRVGLFMDNCAEAVISIFGILKAGAAFIPVNHTTKKDKLEYILNDASVKVLISQGRRSSVLKRLNCPRLRSIVLSGPPENGGAFPDFDDMIRFAPRRAAGVKSIDLDLAAVIYTSGSTGRPKGVMLSHHNMVSAAQSITTYLNNTEQDVIMNVLPLSFDYGLYQVLMGFQAGASVVLEKSFAYPAAVLDLMTREGVTGFPGVPALFAILLKMKDIDRVRIPSLRYITNTAAALPKSHVLKLKALFPDVKIYSMYGLTECKRVSYLPPEELERRPLSVGRGMPNEEVYVVNEKGERARPGEVGELVVRGANVMMGYWNLPEETARCLRPGRYPGERVLYTGDLFISDEEGYLYFVARKDDIIKSGGEKISPREIENVLHGHERVVEAAVVGVPDEILGQAIKAFIVPDSGVPVSEKEILHFCAARLESFMVPKYIEIRDRLPKTVTGKISKQKLKTGAALQP